MLGARSLLLFENYLHFCSNQASMEVCEPRLLSGARQRVVKGTNPITEGHLRINPS